MGATNKKHGTRKRIVIVTLALLLALPVIFFYDSFTRPREVNNGMATLHRKFTEHTGHVWSVVFNPKGETLASGGVDGVVKIWRADDGAALQNLRHPMGVTFLAYSPDGNYLATCSYDS